jgi:hypothetical protein
MKNRIFQQYSIMAEQMNAQSKSSGEGQPSYHVLADALFWEDEIPVGLEVFSGDCLRFVLRYRTSLMLDAPESKWQEYWSEAKRCFPNWVGFSPERCRPDNHLGTAYQEMSAEAMKKIKHLTDGG